jgi:hypothetical protein
MERREMRNTRKKTAPAVVVIACLLLATSGCVWTPELARVAGELERQIPEARFDKEFSLSLGPVAISFARLVTGFVGDDDVRHAREYIRDVSRVQVAIYDTGDMPSISNLRMPSQLAELEDRGWETAVKVREDDEAVWVMYRVDGDAIRDLYVVVLNDDELVLVKATGRLDRIMAKALVDADRERGIRDLGHEIGDEFRDG